MSEAAMVETPAPAPAADDVLYEVVDGRVMEKPYWRVHEALIAMCLAGRIYHAGESNRAGRVVFNTLFALDLSGDLKRRPEVAFISYERWPRRSPMPTGDALEVIPDLAVEIVNPSDAFSDMVGRIDEYFQAGVRLVWVILSGQNKVYVYTSPTEARILQSGDVLDGGALIPGFRMPVKSLFEDED